jgi:hypothetical protein
MPLNPAARPDSSTRYQNWAFLFCITFGLAVIANVQLANDSVWLWYAIFARSGRHIYSDMHLVLQPLFVLETEWLLALFGRGWIAIKIPAILHLVAYCFGLRLLLRYSTLPDRQKALLMASAFSVSICTGLYRLDDYHFLNDCFTLASLVGLLMLRQFASNARRSFGLVAALGILSGLSFTNRVNDGGALFVGVAISIFCFLPFRRLVSLLLFTCTTAITILGIVHLTGDTFRVYATTSIFRAAGSKGGAGSILTYPFLLPWNTRHWLSRPINFELILYPFIIGAIWQFLLRPLGTRRQPVDLLKAAIGVALILGSALYMRKYLLDDFFMISFTTLTVFALYFLGCQSFLRFLRWEIPPGHHHHWNRLEILFLIPLGQLISMATSSGGFHYGNYSTTATLMILLPIVFPEKIRSNSIQTILTVVVAYLLCFGVAYKVKIPYSWHSYRAAPMFVGRQWYRHPVYGPMIIETKLLNFIEPICKETGTSTPGGELLSMPNPYANYFCDIPPWHEYVQTFFDTSSKETIETLMHELQKAPPQWILYERQLDSLAVHEEILNKGQPLPHRYLDQLIMQKIDSADWQTVYTSSYGDRLGNSETWYLLRTGPGPATPPLKP